MKEDAFIAKVSSETGSDDGLDHTAAVCVVMGGECSVCCWAEGGSVQSLRLVQHEAQDHWQGPKINVRGHAER